jgi:hypothetical protein
MWNIRNGAVLASGFAGALLLSAAALGAGAYDGTWIAKVTSGGCAGTVVTITVADNVASGHLSGAHAATLASRAIDSDGTVSWSDAKRGYRSDVTFAGSSFVIKSSLRCGHLSVTGSRQ